MRQVFFAGSVLGVMICCGIGGAATARAEAELARPACVKLALRKKRLDNSRLRRFLAMSPEKVRSEHGRPVMERVRNYIALSEKVLFKCPPFVLNATMAPLRWRMSRPPPLPTRGPKQTRSVRPRGGLVPLPVKRSRRLKRFKFPENQG